MQTVVNNWGPSALIVFGYMVAAFWQNKRIDDMKDWVKAEFSRVHDRFDRMEKTLDKLDARVKALEDDLRSPLVKR